MTLDECPNGSILVDDALTPIMQKACDADNEPCWFDMHGNHVESVKSYCNMPNMRNIELFLYMGPFNKKHKLISMES